MEIIETLDIPCALEFIPSTQEPAQATIAPEPAQTTTTQEPAQTTITQEPAQTTITQDIKPKKKYVKDWKKYNKTFYEKNKDNKKTCPDCGHQYMYSVYSQHKKLKKHINGILLNTLERKVDELKAKIF